MLTYADLHPYQERAISFLYGYDQTVLRILMGGGKTVIGGTAATELLDGGIAKRWLIQAPKRVCQLVWRQEFAKWEHLKDRLPAIAVGTPDQRMEAIEGANPIVVMNYENIDWLIDTYSGLYNFDAAIYDELTRLKNPQGKRYKKFVKHLDQLKVRIGMTGMFAPNGAKDIYGQVFCVDGGKRLGKSFSRFRQQYFDKTGPMAWQWEPQKDAIERISGAVADITFQIDDSVYADQLPPLVENRIEVDLGGNYDIYFEMEKEYLLALDGDDVMAANAGVAQSKCQQIADGFIYKERGSIWLHDRKLDALGELIDSMDGQPLIVAYKFRRELEAMLGRWTYPYLGSGVSDAKAEQAVDDWNEGKLPVLYVHPASAGHGLNLQHGGNTICWYGQTWSLEEYEQTIARLRRQGQASSQVWCHHIIAKDTVDEDILAALDLKADVDAAVVAGIRARHRGEHQ